MSHTSHKVNISQNTHTYLSYFLQITSLANYTFIFLIYITNSSLTKYPYFLPIHITNTSSHKTSIAFTISILLKRYQTLILKPITWKAQTYLTEALLLEGTTYLTKAIFMEGNVIHSFTITKRTLSRGNSFKCMTNETNLTSLYT